MCFHLQAAPLLHAPRLNSQQMLSSMPPFPPLQPPLPPPLKRMSTPPCGRTPAAPLHAPPPLAFPKLPPPPPKPPPPNAGGLLGGKPGSLDFGTSASPEFGMK